MGDPKGFLISQRKSCAYRDVEGRKNDFKEVAVLKSVDASIEQASRCMDCGTPFCNWGCPIGNYIPEWNDLVFAEKWGKAFSLLNATNCLPEITGRVCPAPCEYACVLGINDDPVTIRENELGIIEYAFKNGLVNPHIPQLRSGKKVAVVGSGPAGISAAEFLNRAGHNVVIFERDKKAGGIMRYGIPDFKLEKRFIERRLEILKKEGIEILTGIDIGKDKTFLKLNEEFDAVCLAIGSRVPRDLKIKGRELDGIYFAMEYLTQSNRKISGEKIEEDELIDAKGKNVVVIGGGDTGSDCIGTACRQGAKKIVQIELLPKPFSERPAGQPWPKYPILLKTTSSHEEGCERCWAVSTKEFEGESGKMKRLRCSNVDFSLKDKNGSPLMKEIQGTDFTIETDLVLLAMGFLHPEHDGLLKDAGISLDQRGNVIADRNFMTNIKGVFSAGDMRRGQSLVVWAIAEGIAAATGIDRYLRG